MDHCPPVLPENVFKGWARVFTHSSWGSQCHRKLEGMQCRGHRLKDAVMFWYESWCGYLVVIATCDSCKVLLCYAASEVPGVTFTDSDSAPVPKCLNPGPAILQLRQSASFSNYGGNHRSNRNFPMFLLKKWPCRLLLLLKLKSDSGSGSAFLEIFDSGPDLGPKEKRIIQLESTPVPPRAAFGVHNRRVCQI